ncbi:DUF7305 domain-containing protein [Pseudaeromonas pectinilytica]
MKNTTMLAGAKRGYVLVSVLVLSLVASMVVFVSIRENQLQERMSGNQQKMINARLAAERGIAAALDYITTQMASGSDINAIATGSGLSALRGTPDNYRLSNVVYVNADKRLSLLSTGHDLNNDATAQLVGRFELVSNGSARAKGVIGCEDLKVNGGGFIDSYDSSKGGYNLNSNHGSNAFVALVNGPSINLQGEPTQTPTGLSLINGDFITYNGELHTKGSGSIVSGNVTANGGVILNGGTSVGGNIIANGDTKLNGKSSVGGNVHAAGGFIVNGGANRDESSSVGGNVSAESVTLNGNASINGNVISSGELVTNGNTDSIVINGSASAASANLKGTILGSLSVGAGSYETDNRNGTVLGNVDFNATSRPMNTEPSIPGPGVLAEYCKQILAENTWLKQQLGTLPAGNNGELTNSAFSNMNDANNKTYSKLDLTGDNNTDRRVIDVTQNTTLYVTGEIKMTNLTIKVSQGKNLTIKQVTNGQGRVVDMNDVAIVSADGAPLGTANNGGVPPFSLYSDNKGQVNIRAENGTANSPMFAAIYAPLAEIYVKQGAGELSGSILGKIIDIQNPKGFHYDEALGNAGGGASSSSIKLTSILDYFPEQVVELSEEEE